jgi:protein-arginine kinase
VFTTQEKDVVILVNFIDHLQLIVTAENNSDFATIYNYSKDLIQSFERNLKFDFDISYGYLNVNPLLIGSGLVVTSDITLKNLIRFNDFQKNVEHLNFDEVKIKNNSLITKSFCKLCYVDDLKFTEDYYSKISGLINIDKDKENIATNFSFSKLKLDDKIDKAIYEAYDKNYDILKNVISPSGLTLNSLVRMYHDNPSNRYGIIATERSDYSLFHNFFSEYLKISQNYDSEKQETDVSLQDDGLIDLNYPDKVISIDICLIRNIADFPFPSSKFAENLKVEDKVIGTLENLKSKGLFGKYISFQNEDAARIIKANNITIFNNEDFLKLGINADFPKNRGLILFENYNFSSNTIYAIINDLDHFKFHVHIENCNLNTNFLNILKISNDFSKVLKFLNDKNFGILSACPKFLGTGLCLKSELKLVNLIKNRHLIEEVLQLKNFSYKILNEAEGLIEINNKLTIGKTEIELMSSLIFAINELAELDK